MFLEYVRILGVIRLDDESELVRDTANNILGSYLACETEDDGDNVIDCSQYGSIVELIRDTENNILGS